MTASQKESTHKTLNSILLSVISIFGVFSLVLLISLNSKVNEIAIGQAVIKNELKSLDRRVTHLEGDGGELSLN